MGVSNKIRRAIHDNSMSIEDISIFFNLDDEESLIFLWGDPVIDGRIALGLQKLFNIPWREWLKNYEDERSVPEKQNEASNYNLMLYNQHLKDKHKRYKRLYNNLVNCC